MIPDLSTLNDAERGVLRLLARGHTAKSIAAETGVTEGSVNERLREARRKTGAGSSRELARLLHAQENRDEEIGLNGADFGPETDRLEAASREAGGRTRKGSVVMAVVLIGAVGGMLLLMSGPQSPSSGTQEPPVESRFAEVLPSDDASPRRLYQQLRSEARDASWADRAENWMRTRFSTLPEVGDLQVRCAATLCEAIGDVRPGRSPAGEDATVRTQRIALEANGALGLKPASFLISGSPTKEVPTFITYWAREASASGRATAASLGKPRVVSTVPASGAVIAPGPFTLNVTFDRPMRAGNYSFIQFDPTTYPNCANLPRQSADGLTFKLACRAEAGRQYEVGLNDERYRNFKSEEGVSAEPYLLRFAAR